MKDDRYSSAPLYSAFSPLAPSDDWLVLFTVRTYVCLCVRYPTYFISIKIFKQASNVDIHHLMQMFIHFLIHFGLWFYAMKLLALYNCTIESIQHQFFNLSISLSLSLSLSFTESFCCVHWVCGSIWDCSRHTGAKAELNLNFDAANKEKKCSITRYNQYSSSRTRCFWTRELRKSSDEWKFLHINRQRHHGKEP